MNYDKQDIEQGNLLIFLVEVHALLFILQGFIQMMSHRWLLAVGEDFGLVWSKGFA